MFTRYNINDLFLAYVVETIPNNNSVISYHSIGYLTILKKNGENYIDLQNKDRVVTTRRNPNEKCFVIYEIEPLSKHYTQEGKKINKFTRKKALNAGNKHYNVVYNKIAERTKAI